MNTDFSGARLVDVSFADANVRGSNFGHCNLAGATFKGAVGLKEASFVDAIGLDSAVFAAHWRPYV